MRVSPCGFAAKALEEAMLLAQTVTQVTHNHPESMKAAEAVISAIYLARIGKTLDEIQDYITERYYRIDFTLDEIRPSYHFDVSCQGSVPQAFAALFESSGFEDAMLSSVFCWFNCLMISAFISQFLRKARPRCGSRRSRWRGSSQTGRSSRC